MFTIFWYVQDYDAYITWPNQFKPLWVPAWVSIVMVVDVLYFDLLTHPEMPFKVMHRKEMTHSSGIYERKSRGRKLADEMRWGKKKILWYSHRLTHRKWVTSELHDSYFRLMTIKHSISKIAWVIKWVLNYYIAQSTQKSRSGVVGSWVEDRTEFEFQWSRAVVGKATSGRRGLWALMSWGPEKMLIKGSKEGQHPAESTPGLRLRSPRERERHNANGHNFGVKIFQLCSISSSLSQ